MYMTDKNIRIDGDTWELLNVLRKKQGRTLKGMIRHLAKSANKPNKQEDK